MPISPNEATIIGHTRGLLCLCSFLFLFGISLFMEARFVLCRMCSWYLSWGRDTRVTLTNSREGL